jgi:hypothetical protein
MPENPGPSPWGLISAPLAAPGEEPFILPFFEFFLAEGLSGLSAEEIFPWESV